MNIQLISVPVEITGEYFIFLDKDGNEIFGKKIHRHRVENIHSIKSERIAWGVAIRNAATKINRSHTDSRLKTDWDSKIESLTKSFRIRSKDLKLPKIRKQFDRFLTHTWRTSIRRMIQQFRSHYVYHCESPWKRWATCACKNNNRRSIVHHGQVN